MLAVGTGRDRPGVLLLEWADPPYISGHWNPEIIALAGGREVLGRPGSASRRASWGEIVGASPEVLLLSPCGFALDRAEAEASLLGESVPEWRGLPAVRDGRAAMVDGSSYFSRPGPRLAESLAIAAAVIDPERCADLAPAGGWRRLLVTE